MRSPYLSTERLTLRAMVAADAAVATGWFPAPFPVSAEQAGRWLVDVHRSSPWDDPATLWLAIVRHGSDGVGTSDCVIGGVRLLHPRARTSDLSVHPAPHLTFEESDALQAEVVRLVVPWVRDELEAMVLTLSIGSDQPDSIAAAEGLGMIRAARLREHLARSGKRADLLWYQALNPRGRAPDPTTSNGASGA